MVNDGLKQRLLGAVVMSCIALILWPLIFSDVSGPEVDRRSQIPPLPAFEKYTVTEPVRPINIEPVAQAGEATVAAKLAAAEKLAEVKPEATAAKPSLDERGLPRSWVIQVASFKKKSNAKDLMLALQQRGLKAYTRVQSTAKGSSTRVFVGPKLSKEALNKDRIMIDKVFSVTSMVVPFSLR